MSKRRLNAKVCGVSRLQYDQTQLFSSPGSSGCLRQEGKRLFGGPKVGKIKANVAIDNSYQGNAWEIVAFGYHLRTHKNIDFTVSDLRQNSSIILQFLRFVAVQPFNAGSRKKRGDLFVNFLGSSASVFKSRGRTLRAAVWPVIVLIAIMTEKYLLRLMIRKGHLAVLTGERVATSIT